MDTPRRAEEQQTQSPEKMDKLRAILNRVRTSENIAESLPGIIEDLKDVLECEAITLFALDRANRQLYSRNYITDAVPEIRIDISIRSLAGFVAATGKSLNITDAYNETELRQFHPQLSHGSTLDKILNYRTQSIMVLPLPYNRRLIGILEIINKKGTEAFSETDFKRAREISPAMGLALVKLDEQGSNGLESEPKFFSTEINTPQPPADGERAYSSRSSESLSGNGADGGPDSPTPEERLHKISQSIHSAKNVDEILIKLKHAILELFDCNMITIYAVDAEKNEIYSKVKSGEKISEIRVPISPLSIAGWVAMVQRNVNIQNVDDEEELRAYHPNLTFDASWDKLSGYKTVSMLAQPMVFKNKLLGVLQLVNKKSAPKFTPQEENFANIIAETIALAFYNQEKFVQQKPTKFSYLVNNGLLTEEELAGAISKARKNQVDPETVLLGSLGISRKDLGKSLEHFYDVPYYGYSDSIILPKEALVGLNKNFLAKNFWIPIQSDGQKVTILTNDPANPDKHQNIKLIFPKKDIEFKVGLKVDIIDFLNSMMGDDEPGLDLSKTEEMSSLLSALQNESDSPLVESQDEDDESNAISETDSTIVRLVNKILTDAYDRGVSDVHIEPGMGREKVSVRFRKDGECLVYEEIPALYKQAIISRIKIMARLDIAERRLPQDGKIKMKYGKRQIEYRVATCPTVGGNEDAVLRILAASKPIPLDQMNFRQRNLELIRKMVVKPYGLVLVVGPTGSGKTTTLHSCLGYINTPSKKIWTAEDPVEITQKGLRQVQMHNKIGLDFARAMRSFLRGDPDVIMVGEMRDAETCAIGLEASLTGHLVFSTLHTNSAPETITRLLDMGMNPLNFADALLLIVAQRLVRTLCKHCKEDYHPSREEFDTLVREYGENDFHKLGIEYTSDLTLKKPVGCNHCNNTGYAGRTALHELLEGTEDIKRMIMKKSLVEELRTQALQDGMTTLKQDGIYKIFKGDCDLKQVLSVCIV